MQKLGITLGLLAVGLLCGGKPAAAQTTVNLTVAGTADPWLAGMPNGTIASAFLGEFDIAPNQSPAQVAGLTLRPGNVLRFGATGAVSKGPARPFFGPDGDEIRFHQTGAEHGISDITTPLMGLIGVFLGPDQPNLSGAPGALDFSTQTNRDYMSLTPMMKQVFFIGDGKTSGGQQQEIVIPACATRLYLGPMDGFGWSDNLGSFEVSVTEITTDTILECPEVPEPSALALFFPAVGLVLVLRRRRS